MRTILLAMSATVLATTAAAATTPLEYAEPYFMQAEYAKAFAIVRNYFPTPRSLRLDFVFGVSACLSGDDANRALGLMMLNAITTSYRLSTEHAAKLSSYMARCQPVDAVVNTLTLASADGVGASTHQTEYMKKFPSTRQIPGLQAIEAKRLENEFVAVQPGTPIASPTASEILKHSRVLVMHKMSAHLPIIDSPKP